MKREAITILGSTGSIGVSTLSVLERHPQRFEVFALTAQSQAERLFEQCRRYAPRHAVMRDPAAAARLDQWVREAGLPCEVHAGEAALEEVASSPEVDTVMAAIVGAAGLRPTLAAARAGKKILLANKEALVMAGNLLIDAVKAGAARLLPIDSEHNAIFQALPRDFAGDLAGAGIRRILLTASGGPFRLTPVAGLAEVTPDQACAHPNWVMGRKISVDSATMMNKGLEVIEARWLFNAAPEQVEVVIHPQSIVHSLVEYIDGSLLAQLGNPDMRTPIAHALGFPERISSGVVPLDLFKTPLEFCAPNLERFPCLALAYEALRIGDTAPTILNAANEIAVAAFLNKRIGFTTIPSLIANVLETVASRPLRLLDDALSADRSAREAASAWIVRH